MCAILRTKRPLTPRRSHGHGAISPARAGHQQITRAIEWLKRHFSRPLRIDTLAAQANMSASTFHHHFRQVTTMSPLQYLKWLRLNEARRLMLT
ncbi:MAG: helix-turn-helix transcriptional regulator, partial [Candidatus Aminicenantes bacterium]|nr:helix-turn-helix transcriptional regulator [Candidatus Aminicenantes bacterium]